MKEECYGKTLARSIIFALDVHSFYTKFDNIVSEIDLQLDYVLEEIFETFLCYAQCKLLPNSSKSNIYMFMHHLNNLKLDYESKCLYHVYYKEILAMLNSGKHDDCLDNLYCYEISVRKPKLYKITTRKKEEIQKQQINKSIEFDIEVLFSHLDESDEEFANKLIKFVTSPYYTESVRYLMNEYPDLMDNDVFKNRVCMTLEKRSHLGKRYRGFSLEKNNGFIGSFLAIDDSKKLYKKIGEI